MRSSDSIIIVIIT